MQHEYRKIVTIQAEQFDGSIEMMQGYGIKADPEAAYFAGFPLYTIPTNEGNMGLHEGDWIATGIDGEHWAIADDIFRRTYEEVDNG